MTTVESPPEFVVGELAFRHIGRVVSFVWEYPESKVLARVTGTVAMAIHRADGTTSIQLTDPNASPDALADLTRRDFAIFELLSPTRCEVIR